MTKTLPAPRPGWHTKAACAGVDLATFFPSARGTRPSETERRMRRDTARTWCAGCPVITDCAADATREGDHGIRGGSLRRYRGGTAAVSAYEIVRLIPTAPAGIPPMTTIDDYRDQERSRAS